MTPEERFIQIENSLQHSSELHAQQAEASRRHAEEMGELRQMQKSLMVAVGKIAEGQRTTDAKLNDFIEWVKRYLQGRSGNGHEKL